MGKPDSFIFDLDGTLWDGVPTYALAWNNIFRQRGLEIRVEADHLYAFMGLEEDVYLEKVLPGFEPARRREIYRAVIEEQYVLIRGRGGVLYAFVREGLRLLSSRYRLFILSNCPRDTVRCFLEWSKLGTDFTDTVTYGQSPVPKAENIKLLISRHGLQDPVYVGDTESDRLQAERAGIPFIFMSYGFGTASSWFERYDSFRAFANHYR